MHSEHDESMLVVLRQLRQVRCVLEFERLSSGSSEGGIWSAEEYRK
jgi:hypothetical protein